MLNREYREVYTRTRNITMDGTKQLVKKPTGAYDVVISAPSGKVVKYFEEENTYDEDSITYGTGYEASHQLQPVDAGGFYLQGTTGDVIQLVFICGRK